MEKGGNMRAVFTRFCEGLKKVEDSIKTKGKAFMWSEHLGYILTCPSNLGTGLRAGVHVKLPLLCKDKRFDGILKKLCLQKRGTGTFHIANNLVSLTQFASAFTLRLFNLFYILVT